jgi:hypothetical protein
MQKCEKNRDCNIKNLTALIKMKIWKIIYKSNSRNQRKVRN